MKRSLVSATKILTPELRKKVENQTRMYFKIAEKHFKREFPMPEIRFDIKSHTSGIAIVKQLVIRYNLILLFENEKNFLKDDVPHEVAHIVNYLVSPIPKGKKRLMPHGKEWKAIMRDVFGVKPTVTHHYDCSSIERKRRKRKTSRQRVDSAVQIIISVLKRVEKKFTPEERKRFHTFIKIGTPK